MSKPFDNEVVRTKTIWTDEELMIERLILNNAITALEKLGDRYSLVVFDLIHQLNVRNSMASGARMEGINQMLRTVVITLQVEPDKYEGEIDTREGAIDLVIDMLRGDADLPGNITIACDGFIRKTNDHIG